MPPAEQTTSPGPVTTTPAVGTREKPNANGCNQFAIVGNAKSQRVTCPNSGGANVTKYNYPARGSPVVTIKGKFAQPFAAVASAPSCGH